MAWMGNEWRPNSGEMADKETRRRKKLERQEKRVERLNEPLFAWLCKTFRVVTIIATLAFTAVKGYQGMQLGVEHLTGALLFNALATWTTFGLVWAASAVLQIFQLKKNGEGDAAAIRNYWINVAVAVAGMVILLIAVLMVP